MWKMKGKRSPWFAISVLLTTIGTTGGQVSSPNRSKHPPEYTFEVVRRFPHDTTAFTQGLAFYDGYLYEGTGLKGRSSLRQIRVETGEIVRQVALPPEYFGEGITVIGNEVIQLTWQSHVGFVYNRADFRWLRSFSYAGEGWGITSDGRELFMSDGTSEIRVLDSSTLAERRRLKVHDGPVQVSELNELEFVQGEVYANVWHSDRIARISPQSGNVLGWIDLSGILSSVYHLEPEAVLNGIAYDAQGKRLFITGKLWPAIFEIRVVPKRAR
jgi:glutamine cyclotransferase